jgi:ABC-2 type transport system permease protein
VYYPITFIPLPYRYLAYFSPTTYASEIAQNAAGFLPASSGELATYWIILVSVSVVFFLFSATKARWRER